MGDNFWNEKRVKEFAQFYFDDRMNHHFSPIPFEILLNNFKVKNGASSTKATDDVKDRIKIFRDNADNNYWDVYDDKIYRSTRYQVNYTADEALKCGLEIYSALSKDNTEFKIGDVVNGHCIHNTAIKGFEISGNDLMAVFGNNSARDVEAWRERVNIDYLEKAEIPASHTENTISYQDLSDYLFQFRDKIPHETVGKILIHFMPKNSATK